MNTTTLNPAKCLELIPAAEDALYVIASKWTMRILLALRGGDKRFNELQRHLSGISARVLSNELKDLELNGLIARQTLDNGTVLYMHNDYADSLKSVIRELSLWGIQHKQKIRNKEI